MCAVEWKPLKEVCNILNGFAFKSQEYVKDGVRIIRISDVQSGYISDKDLVFYSLDKLDEFKRYLLKTGDLVMSLTGNPGRVALVTNANMPCALNQRVACLRAKNISNSYLFYLFNSKEFEATAFANSTGGAQKNLSTTWLGDFDIPIPSLAKQQEIVSHLDTFTTLISNLESELDMRRKQYEHYRNQLLDFEGVKGVEWKTLGEVAPYRKSRIEYSLLNTHNYVSVENLLQMKKGKTDTEKVPSEGNAIKYETGDILVGNIRPYLKKIWMAEYVGGTNGDVLVFGIKDKNILISKYLFYLLSSDAFFEYDNQHAKGGKMPRGDKSMIEKYLIPIPSPKAQQEIVEKLDAFENLIQSLEQEIKLRKQQYEYYREKLLTFEYHG